MEKKSDNKEISKKQIMDLKKKLIKDGFKSFADKVLLDKPKANDPRENQFVSQMGNIRSWTRGNYKIIKY